MRRENVEDSLAIRDATAGKNLVTEDNFLTVIMQSGPIQKQSLLVRLLNGPAAEASRYFLHILLRVSAVDSERMQFHQLARVVFVQTSVYSRRFVAFRRIRTRNARSPVVEIEEHCRRMRRRAQQIAKARERERPNRFAI